LLKSDNPLPSHDQKRSDVAYWIHRHRLEFKILNFSEIIFINISQSLSDLLCQIYHNWIILLI